MAYRHYQNINPPSEIRLLIVAEAPPAAEKEKNYFYNLSESYITHSHSRDFFRYLMQAVGLLRTGTKHYCERVLLNEFLKQGYFVIDACPVPLVNEDGKSLPKNSKIKKLRLFQDSLLDIIRKLDPEKILFMCETNVANLNRVENDEVLGGRLLLQEYLPFAGNGQQVKLMKAFPEEYRLKPIY